jgi:hypothetical protein
MKKLTQSMLRELFDYRVDGNLVRLKSGMGPNNKAGDLVGDLNKKKLGSRNARYVTTRINGQHYCVHKLIYMWHTGVMPDELDHINRDTLDNRIENLRVANKSQNACNRTVFVNNTSGVKGVSWNARNKKWFVYVDVNKKRNNIGYFDDIDLAELVAIEAREKLHGVYANHV